MLLRRVFSRLRPSFKYLHAIESIPLRARVLLLILVLMVSDVVPLQFAWIQEPLATCRTLVGQNLWESLRFRGGRQTGKIVVLPFGAMPCDNAGGFSL